MLFSSVVYRGGREFESPMKSIRRSKNAFIESENSRTFLALTLIEVRENKNFAKNSRANF